MKRILFTLAAALLAFVSCDKPSRGEQPAPEEVTYKITYAFGTKEAQNLMFSDILVQYSDGKGHMTTEKVESLPWSKTVTVKGGWRAVISKKITLKPEAELEKIPMDGSFKFSSLGVAVSYIGDNGQQESSTVTGTMSFNNRIRAIEYMKRLQEKQNGMKGVTEHALTEKERNEIISLEDQYPPLE